MDAIEKWIDRSPALAVVRVAVGTPRTTSTLALLAVRDRLGELGEDLPAAIGKDADTLAPCWLDTVDGLGELVVDTLESGGWPEDHPTFRLYAYDSDGRQLPSLQRTSKEGGPVKLSSEDTATRAMADAIKTLVHAQSGVLAQAQAMLATLGDVVSHREEVSKDMLVGYLQAHQGRIDAEGAQYEAAFEGLLEQLKAQGPDESDGLSAHAVGFLGKLAKKLGFDLDGPEDLDAMADAALEDPARWAAIQDALQRAMARKADKAESEADESEADGGDDDDGQ